MKRFTFRSTRLQRFCFLASMPIIDILLNFIFFDAGFFSNGRLWLLSFPLIFVLGLVSWKLHLLVGNSLRLWYPELKQTAKRVGWLACIIIPLMSSSILSILILYNHFHLFGYTINREDTIQALFVGFAVNIIFETLYEAEYALDQYQESLGESEDIQQLSLQTEFDNLRNQVNPHFLFNCFNTLSSLISVDKVKAEEFLNELSKVYRYLLRNNREGLSTVENELKFIDSYYKLLRTRHGDAVEMNISVDREFYQYLLPSLSLQMLVENVVKHNVLSKNKPLTIDIFSTRNKKLIVNNNLQRRSRPGLSGKVGLENIRMKYNLLRQEGFQVMEDTKNYTVVLPLIFNGAATGLFAAKNT